MLLICFMVVQRKAASHFQGFYVRIFEQRPTCGAGDALYISLVLLIMTNTLRFTLALCGAILLAYSGYLAWSFYYGVDAKRSPFSPAAWKEKANVYALSNDPGCVRGGIALDIVATNLLLEKPIAEVKALLGEPDGTKEGQIYYELGQCSGYGWHNSVLQVSFLNNLQVTNAVILRQ